MDFPGFRLAISFGRNRNKLVLSLSLTQEIGGDSFQVVNTCRYDRDPHYPRDAKKLSLSPIKLRSIDSSTAAAVTAANTAAAAAAAKAAEPNVDFEFHVNIFINRWVKYHFSYLLFLTK